MNIVHGKKANSVVLEERSHLDLIPTPSKLSIDKMFMRQLRRFNVDINKLTYKKGVK